jgi:Flp pilus assembly protein TadD
MWNKPIAKLLSCSLLGALMFSGCASVPSSGSKLDLGLTAGETDVQEIISQADQKRARGEKQGALVLYIEASKITQDSYVWSTIGQLQSELTFNKQALVAYERAISLDASNTDAHEGAGLIYLDTKSISNAKILLEKAVELDPSRWRSYSGLGVIADLEQRYPDAIRHYQLGLEIAPESAMLLSNIGYSRYLAGDLEQAEQDFLSAISIDNSYETAWRNLGLVFARTRRYEEAVEVLQLSSEEQVARNDVGYVALLNEDYQTAEALFDDAIRLSPRFYDTAHRNRELVRNRMRSSTR